MARVARDGMAVTVGARGAEGRLRDLRVEAGAPAGVRLPAAGHFARAQEWDCNKHEFAVYVTNLPVSCNAWQIQQLHRERVDAARAASGCGARCAEPCADVGKGRRGRRPGKPIGAKVRTVRPSGRE